METWYCSDVTHARMEGLVKRALLHERTDAARWLRHVLHALPRVWTHDSSQSVLLGTTAPLPNRATAYEPQRDPAHRGLHRTVRGISRDQAPL